MGVSKVAKSDRYLRLDCLSVRPFVCVPVCPYGTTRLSLDAF